MTKLKWESVEQYTRRISQDIAHYISGKINGSKINRKKKIRDMAEWEVLTYQIVVSNWENRWKDNIQRD